MTVKIQLRRGTAAEWTSANPTLLSGEQGLETDTGKTKIGDGVTAWNSLGYAFVQNALVNAKGDLITATANDTPAVLTAGSNGQMLMADSSATAGLRYVDPPTNRNLIINGAMNVHQRGTSSSGFFSGLTTYRTVDRWITGVNLGTWTQSVESDGPTGSGMQKSVKMLCTTANASPAGASVVFFYQRIEGQNLQSIKKGTSSAQQITASFWVKSNVTGTFVVEVVDDDNTRHVSLPYSVTTADTWERKTLLIPADTTGALDNDNAASLSFIFWLAAGSDRTSGTLASTWASRTSANIYAGGSNLAAATNNYWQITGVQLEVGPVATPFEFEPYEATLRKCQRYYFRIGDRAYTPLAQGIATGANLARCFLDHKVRMRAAPTELTYSGTVSFSDGGNLTNLTSITLDYGDLDMSMIYANLTGGFTVNRPVQVINNNSATGYIAVSAEL